MDDESFNANFWLFGYGFVSLVPVPQLSRLPHMTSAGVLIWKPPPHFDKRVPGYIQGYVRRFWQASEDHRGTPEAPGRVVTLIDRAHWETLTDHHGLPASEVWGAAYHIPPEHVEEVRTYLDIREINGYSIQFTDFHPSHPQLPKDGRENSQANTINCLVYIGLPANPQFLGPQDPQALAAHILKSHGPSGENKEYLYLLEKALLELSPDSKDEHISDLVRRCKALEITEKGGRHDANETGERSGPHGIDEGVLHRVGSIEEQEEVEK